jgi:hypothetical protein
MISNADKFAAEYYERMLKREFEAGDKSLLLWTLYTCLQLRRPLPEWLRTAFLAAYDSATEYEIKSWDDAFGRPHPKNTHFETEKRKLKLRPVIIGRVEALKAQGVKIDKDLFERVGEELRISGTVVSDIYYDRQSRKLRKTISEIF